jgi:hypothetical protein
MSKRFIKWLVKYEKSSREKGMTGFLIKKRLARSKKTANAILVSISIFFLAISPLMFIII